MSRLVELWQRASGIKRPQLEEGELVSEQTGAPGPQKPKPKRLDAMRMTGAQVRARLASLGLPPHPAYHCTEVPPRSDFDDEIAAVIADTEQERAEAHAQRVAELEAGAIDGRTASPEQLRARFQQLGVLSAGGGSIASHDAHGVFDVQRFRSVDDEALPPSGRAPTAEELHVRRVDQAEQVVDAIILDAARRGVPVDTRRFDSTEMDAYLRKRELTVSDAWTLARARSLVSGGRNR